MKQIILKLLSLSFAFLVICIRSQNTLDNSNQIYSYSDSIKAHGNAPSNVITLVEEII